MAKMTEEQKIARKEARRIEEERRQLEIKERVDDGTSLTQSESRKSAV